MWHTPRRNALTAHHLTIHVTAHGLDLILTLAINDTTVDIPAQLKSVALRHVSLSIGGAVGILSEVRDLHSGGRVPITRINTLVEGAAVHTKSLALDSLVGRIAGAASRKGKLVTTALTARAVNCITTSACLNLLVRTVPPVAVT